MPQATIHLVGIAGDRLTTAVRQAGLAVLPLDREPRAPVVAAGRSVEDAVAAGRGLLQREGGGAGWLVVADEFHPAGVRQALRAGVRAMLPRAEVTPERLGAAVRSARHRDGLLPHAVLVKLLGGGEPAHRQRPGYTLTRRQTLILRMIAEGHGNAAIAGELSCSPHTVKNVIYELMAQLQAGNRAHAVARGIHAGLI